MSNYGGYDSQGGFGSQTDNTPSQPRRDYDAQTLIPVTIKMVLEAMAAPGSSVGASGDFHLLDERPLHMIKLVAAVRDSSLRSTNFFLDVEDGTGVARVKVYTASLGGNEAGGDYDCSGLVQLRNQACQDNQYIRIIGQIREFDGTRQIVANDVRAIASGDEITHHFLEVAYSHDKHCKRRMMGPVTPGYGIMSRGGPTLQAGSGTMMQVGRDLGGGSALHNAVLSFIQMEGGNSESGVHIHQITSTVSSQGGFSANDIRNAINYLSNEGHIYSTIDENHFMYAS